MLGKIVSNIVSGAIGLFALYAVAKLAYRAGTEMARMENHYRTMGKGAAKLEERGAKLISEAGENPRVTEPTSAEAEEDETPETTEDAIVVKAEDVISTKLTRRGGFFSRLRGMTGSSKVSVIKELLRNPDGHRIEACVNGGAVDIRISNKGG